MVSKAGHVLSPAVSRRLSPSSSAIRIRREELDLVPRHQDRFPAAPALAVDADLVESARIVDERDRAGQSFEGRRPDHAHLRADRHAASSGCTHKAPRQTRPPAPGGQFRDPVTCRRQQHVAKRADGASGLPLPPPREGYFRAILYRIFVTARHAPESHPQSPWKTLLKDRFRERLQAGVPVLFSGLHHHGAAPCLLRRKPPRTAPARPARPFVEIDAAREADARQLYTDRRAVRAVPKVPGIAGTRRASGQARAGRAATRVPTIPGGRPVECCSQWSA